MEKGLKANSYLSPQQRNLLYVKARAYGVKLEKASSGYRDKPTKIVYTKNYDDILDGANKKFKEQKNMKTVETIECIGALRDLHIIALHGDRKNETN